MAGYCQNFFGHTDANPEGFGTEGTNEQHAFFKCPAQSRELFPVN